MRDRASPGRDRSGGRKADCTGLAQATTTSLRRLDHDPTVGHASPSAELRWRDDWTHYRGKRHDAKAEFAEAMRASISDELKAVGPPLALLEPHSEWFRGVATDDGRANAERRIQGLRLPSSE